MKNEEEKGQKLIIVRKGRGVIEIKQKKESKVLP